MPSPFVSAIGRPLLVETRWTSVSSPGWSSGFPPPSWFNRLLAPPKSTTSCAGALDDFLAGEGEVAVGSS